ncbi:MAG: hypothetical protein ABL901_18245 [Hyphomicrobiaceae bacterium]
MLMRSEATVPKKPAPGGRQAKNSHAKTSGPSSYKIPSRNDQSQTSFPAVGTPSGESDTADAIRQLLGFFN